MSTIAWLLDSDPALRWQVLRDLTPTPFDEVVAERARVAREGWGSQLLALRDKDGQWAGGACFPGDFYGDFSKGQPWTSTFPTLTLLRQLGVDPHDDSIVETMGLVAKNSRWEHDGQRFFDGEVEPCINGQTVAVGAYFNVDVDRLVDRLLSEQLDDGGWNCETENGSVRSSFHTTICVLEGLLEHERAGHGSVATLTARRQAEQYLIDRQLMHRLSTGQNIDEDFLQFAFPTWWHYDVLRALDYFRAAGTPPRPEFDEAIALVRSKNQDDDRWLLDKVHPGEVHFSLEEGEGKSSKWITMRAMRVLAWHSRFSE